MSSQSDGSTGLAGLIPPALETYLRRRRYYRILRTQEPELDAQICRSYLKPGDVAIDVGANVGVYTKVFSECVGATGSVHALEPVPETFGYLLHNVTNLGLKNVFLYRIAASSSSGISHMYMPLWHGGRRNIYEARLDEAGDIPVRLGRLDDLFAGIKPAFVKIDVEGHEAEVVRGAERLLLMHRPALLVEVTTVEVEELLADLGYRKVPATIGCNCFFESEAGKFKVAAQSGTESTPANDMEKVLSITSSGTNHSSLQRRPPGEVAG